MNVLLLGWLGEARYLMSDTDALILMMTDILRVGNFLSRINTHNLISQVPLTQGNEEMKRGALG